MVLQRVGSEDDHAGALYLAFAHLLSAARHPHFNILMPRQLALHMLKRFLRARRAIPKALARAFVNNHRDNARRALAFFLMNGGVEQHQHKGRKTQPAQNHQGARSADDILDIEIEEGRQARARTSEDKLAIQRRVTQYQAAQLAGGMDKLMKNVYLRIVGLN